MLFGKPKSLLWLIPGLSVMDRYIAAELIQPFLFGVGAFSSVGLAVGTLFDLVRKITDSSLPIGTAIEVLLLQMPQFISYAFPMSALLAAIMAYGRLSSDSELIALRSCGISVYRLVAPALVLSLVVTTMSFVFNELVVPAANYQATITLEKALNEKKPIYKESNIFYPEYGEIAQPNGEKLRQLKRLFYADLFDGQRMIGLTILDWSEQGLLKQIVTSESAIWNPTQKVWDFFNGTIYVISPDATYRDIVPFKNQQLKLPRAPLDLIDKGRNFDEMNIAQSLEYMQIVRIGGDAKRLLKVEVRLHQRIAFPFVCLVFGIVGAALGIRPQRTGRGTSFGISVIVIFAYYLLGFMTGALGQLAIVSPFMAAWLPNFFGLGAGGFLVYRAAR
jgi:lipopolysaccharide export system permease protein